MRVDKNVKKYGSTSRYVSEIMQRGTEKKTQEEEEEEK